MPDDSVDRPDVVRAFNIGDKYTIVLGMPFTRQFPLQLRMCRYMRGRKASVRSPLVHRLLTDAKPFRS